MRGALGLVAVLYVLAYVLVQAWARRSLPRVVVICPLRSETLPQEILERLNPPTRVGDPDRLARAEFSIAYLTDAPGISVASVSDEASLDEKLGPYLHRAIFVDHGHCLACLHDEK